MNDRTAALTAIGVMLLAVLVAVAYTSGNSTPTASHGWMADVEAGLDHVTPEALADLLVNQPERLQIVDVRLPDEFARFHLPGSVNLDLVRLLGAEGRALLDASAAKTIVLVSNGMTHPAQAWVALRQMGYANVRILEDGLVGFSRQVLSPPSLRGATTERRARAEGASFAALRERLRKAPAGAMR